MNVSTTSIKSEDELVQLFALLGQPARLKILLMAGRGRLCVCHLQVILGLRQPYISQQLMLLRKAGLVVTTREGRNIYYELADPRLYDLIRQAATLIGVSLPDEPIPEIAGCPYFPRSRSST